MSDLTLVALPVIAEAVAEYLATAWVGVGNGTTAFATNQTDLTGTSKERIACSSVTADGNTVIFAAEFGLTDGAFTWEESGVFTAETGGTMIVRALTPSIGAKSALEEWTAEARVTFSLGA